MTKKITLITLIIASLTGSNALYANEHHADHKQHNKHQHHDKAADHSKVDRMAKALDLTPVQITAIEKIKQEQHAHQKQSRPKMKALYQAIKQEVHTEQFNQAKVRDLAQQKGQLVAEMTMHKTKMKHQIHQLLTAEQRIKWEKIIAKKHQKLMKKKNDQH